MIATPAARKAAQNARRVGTEEEAGATAAAALLLRAPVHDVSQPLQVLAPQAAAAEHGVVQVVPRAQAVVLREDVLWGVFGLMACRRRRSVSFA